MTTDVIPVVVTRLSNLQQVNATCEAGEITFTDVMATASH